MTNTELLATRFRPIPGYEDCYGIDTEGNVYSFKNNVCLKQYLTNSGYLSVHLCKDGKRTTCNVHRLVAITYIPRVQEKNQIDHIDTNKKNNRVDNLRWCTPKENTNNVLTLKYRMENALRGEQHPCYGKPHPKEASEKARQKMLGHKVSEETRKKIGDANRGRKMSDEFRRHLSEIRKGKRLGAENVRSISVYQYDKEFNLIKIWPAIMEASRALGISNTCISNCLAGRSKTAGGFIWKRVM